MFARTLLIRADASVAMGTGHVVRCLALAQAWQDAGGRCIFVMAETTTAVRESLLAEQFEIVELSVPGGQESDARQTAELSRRRQADWVILDGYQFGGEYQQILKSAGLRLLVMDDNGHAGEYAADLVLNQNIHAEMSLYPRHQPYTQFLLGTRYSLLRREFRQWRDRPRIIADTGRRVLVTLGGSDPDNITSMVIQALRHVDREDLEIAVVVGGSNPHFAALENILSQSKYSVRLLRDVRNMAELMAWADLAISAAGSTCWEMCLLGLPAIIITVAENQRRAAARLDEIGACKELKMGQKFVSELAELTSQLLASREGRTKMSNSARDLVDGLGAERIVEALMQHKSQTEEASGV